MARYRLVAFSNAADGRDDDYNRWYGRQHMPDVLAIPGMISAERYTCVGEGPHRYMAIYEIETDDLESLIAEFQKRAGTELMPISDALDRATAHLAFWRAT